MSGSSRSTKPIILAVIDGGTVVTLMLPESIRVEPPRNRKIGGISTRSEETLCGSPLEEPKSK